MTAAQPKRRRVRLTRKNKTGVHAKSAELESLVDEVAKYQKAAETAAIKAAAALAQVQEIMKVNGQDKVVTGKNVAEMIVPRSNATTVIDPQQFRAAVTDDAEFYASVKVGVADAKKVLPQKTIDKISTKTPGKKKDPVAKVRGRTEED